MVNFFFFWTREAVTRQTGENELDTKKQKTKMICRIDDLTNVSLLLLRLSDSQ